ERLDEGAGYEQQDERHHDLRDEPKRTSPRPSDDDLSLECDEAVCLRSAPRWKQAAEHCCRQRDEGSERDHPPIETELEMERKNPLHQRQRTLEERVRPSSEHET